MNKNDKKKIDNVNIPFNDEHTKTIKQLSELEKHSKPKRTKGEKFRLVMAIIVSFCVLIEIICFAGAGYIASELIATAPELKVEDFISNESSIMYDADGQVVTELGAYLRENITYDQMPESLIDSVLAIEDSRYFQHFGFDIPRFFKSGLAVLKAGSFVQGGSTLTMQLCKNTYFQTDDLSGGQMAEKGIPRKVQEIYLAVKLDKTINKKQAIELYLNKLNFGGNIRGVQKASIYYFGKNASELNLAESALLAGIINGPNGFNPYYHLDDATKRRNEVINMLEYHGYIDEEEAILARAIKVEDQLVGNNRKQDNATSQYQSYIDVVIQEAIELTGKDPSIYGMTIYTALDRTIQDQIEKIQSSEDIKFPDELMQVAMVTMNNKTGSIVGIGGGRNYDGARLLNRATSQFKQPGSAVKPLLSYALAFEHLGWSLDHIVEDRPITFPLESRVLKNFDGQYRGDVPLMDAVGSSLNIPAILTLQEVVEEVGVKKVVEYMNSIGFTGVTEKNFHLSFAIGGTWFETTPYEMAGAQAAMINGGIYNKPHTIEKIVMQDGTTYYPTEQNHRVLSEGSAWMVCELYNYNVVGPHFNYMQILKRDYPVYAKTGTTDWGRDGLQYGIPEGAAKDKWMIASTSEYTNALWVGYDKAEKSMGTWYSSYKSSLNIPGRINKLILDACEESSGVPDDLKKPVNDLEEITYIYGTYPYAKYEEGINAQPITSIVSKTGKKELVDIHDHKMDTTFNGISAKQNPDGGITVNWSVGNGGCFGDQKDISLIDDYNNVPATGRCLFDYAWVIGSQASYWATVYADGFPVGSISSTTPSYTGWPGDMYGEVKVCGGFTSGNFTSETKCTSFTYNPNLWMEQGW